MLGPAFEPIREPIARRRGDLAVAIAMATLAQGIGIPLALLTRLLVDEAIGSDTSAGDATRTVWILGGALLLLALLRGVCQWRQGISGERLAQGVLADLRSAMFAKLQCLSISYFDQRAAGRTIVRFVGDAGSLRSWLSRTIVSLPADVLTLIGIAAALAWIEPWLLLAAGAPMLALVPFLALVNPRARSLTREGRRAQSHLSGELTDRLQFVASIKSAGAQEASVGAVDDTILRVRDAFVQRGRLDALTRAFSLSVASISLCAIGVVGALLLLQDGVSGGDIVAAVWLALLARAPINRITQANVLHQRARVAMERIDALLRREPERGLDDSLEPFTGEQMRIRLRTLGYRDRARQWRVRGLDATIQGPGVFLLRTDAHTGTLICQLILRLRRPHEGRVALDQRNARRLRVRDIRDRIGWVDIDRAIVPATLSVRDLDELRGPWMAGESLCPGASLEQTAAACHREGRWRGEVRGIEGLRLALACALVGDRRILLLQEPTMGLGETEAERVIDWLAALARDRLVLMIGSDPRLAGIAREVIEPRAVAPEGLDSHGAIVSTL